jgi:NitT/TauT family transport system substrate-binding protein
MQLLNNLADDLRVTGALVGDVDWVKLIDASMLPPDLRSKSSH